MRVSIIVAIEASLVLAENAFKSYLQARMAAGPLELHDSTTPLWTLR